MSCPEPEPPPCCTKCDRDRENNVWVDRGTPGAIGICLLDTMTEDQVIYVLERDERARADLRRVTSDCRLLELADQVKRLPTEEHMDVQQRFWNREKFRNSP